MQHPWFENYVRHRQDVTKNHHIFIPSANKAQWIFPGTIDQVLNAAQTQVHYYGTAFLKKKMLHQDLNTPVEDVFPGATVAVGHQLFYT